MSTYGISFRDDNSNITMEAEFYEIKDGFLRLYHTVDNITQEFAAYNSQDVRHCVLQEECIESEVLKKVKG